MIKPKVLFREFGDSSLNFELRVFLHNVDSRLSVVSDLNFAIDKAFSTLEENNPLLEDVLVPIQFEDPKRLPDAALSKLIIHSTKTAFFFIAPF